MKRWGGRKAAALTALTLDTYGTICHLCNHAGADSADHIITRKVGGPDVVANLRPAHLKPCPTCDVRCNQTRGATPHQPRVVEWPPIL